MSDLAGESLEEATKALLDDIRGELAQRLFQGQPALDPENDPQNAETPT